jgi:hypothetical protein
MPEEPTGGYIKLYRSILKWEWFDDANTFRLFAYLLLAAAYEPTIRHGIPIKRGEVLTGRKKLSTKLHISEQSIRTALIHLQNTGEITITTTKTHTVIFLINYEKYQGDRAQTNQDANQESTNKSPDNQPRTNQEPTNKLTTIKEIKKERRKEDKKDTPPSPPGGCEAEGNESVDKALTPSQAKALIEGFTVNPEVRTALAEFVEYRRAKKDPMSSRALTKAFKVLKTAKAPAEQVMMIDQAITASWTGIFPLKNQSSGYARKPEADTRSKDYGGWER